MGVPDAVPGQLAQIEPLAEPLGGSIHTRLIAQSLDFLAEGNGTLGAVGLSQTIGTSAAVGGTGGLAVKVDGVIEAAAVQDIPAALRLFPGFVLIDGLTEEVDAHLQTRVPGVGKMLLKQGILHQRAAAIAAVPDADDDKIHARLLDLLPVDLRLIFGHINAEVGRRLHAVGVEVIELVVDGTDAGDRLVGALIVIIGLAAHGTPAGIDRLRGLGGSSGLVLLILDAEEPLPEPLEEAVLAVKAGGLQFGFVQRSGVQRGADLFRGQQDGAVLGGDLRLGQFILDGVGTGRGLRGFRFCSRYTLRGFSFGRGGFRLCGRFHAFGCRFCGRLRSGVVALGRGLLRRTQRIFRGQSLGLLLELRERILLLDLRRAASHGIRRGLRLCRCFCRRFRRGRGALCRSRRCRRRFRRGRFRRFHRLGRGGLRLRLRLRGSFRLCLGRFRRSCVGAVAVRCIPIRGLLLPPQGGRLHGKTRGLRQQQSRGACAADGHRQCHDHCGHRLPCAAAYPLPFLF